MGSPTNPTSASSFNRSSIHPDSPRSPSRQSAAPAAPRWQIACSHAPHAHHERPQPAAQARPGRCCCHRQLPPGSREHWNHAVLPPRPVPVRPFAVPSLLSPKVLAAPQGAQIPPRRIADQDDVAAMAAISTVGPALGHMSLRETRRSRSRRPRPQPRSSPCRPAPRSALLLGGAFSANGANRDESARIGPRPSPSRVAKRPNRPRRAGLNSTRPSREDRVVAAEAGALARARSGCRAGAR